MCLVFVCDEEERVLLRQQAPGSNWRFCFLPLYWRTKRKFYCSLCTRKLVVQ
ncbi:hypothetical protein D8674_034319 [Pyrus ussuriensis x Pyrus communis]|uniref:Uncharacterized protein n=1 Tax=Pyrus ussuriensis x Pyrus communis TaxID=2448454 RepID=A0A5N5I1M5_9ROSA|nr:hypothetical protein D8674_034319 [Pyrus ussuriensis x Pyrus communis]